VSDIVSRPSLRETAYETIRSWISSGRLAEGTVTSETYLAGQLDMSRTPVRAALQQLENEGFLRIAPKHGILILHASAERVSDLLETLIMLILFAYEHNKETSSAEISDLVRHFMHQLEQSASAPSLVKAEADLWLSLISLSQNRELIRLWHATADKLEWHNNSRRWKPPYRRDTQHQLEQLLSAITVCSESTGSLLLSYLQLWKASWT